MSIKAVIHYIIMIILLPGICHSETLKCSVFDAPPYMIKKFKNEKEDYTGIDIDIIKEIAKRMNLEVEFINCPWKRCLWLLQNGKSDILSSVYKKPEREDYLIFLERPYLTSLPISFYFKKGNKHLIKKYEDLYSLNSIGVLRGASYFDKFDNDTNLKKYEVSSQDQLFPMIVNDRVEVMAGYVPTENYRLIAEGYKDKVEKSDYEFENPSFVYIAISKNSPFAKRIDEVNRVNNELIENGFIQKTIDYYYKMYTP